MCGRRIRESDSRKKLCDEKMIDLPELDTVMICRDLRMTMEIIMTRDQRTTSHRVLERDSSSSYQKIIGASTESSATMRNPQKTRTTSQNLEDELMELNNTGKQKTEKSEDKFAQCLTCRDRCYCRDNARRYGGDGYEKNCNSRNISNRSPTIGQHKNHCTTWLRLGSLLVTLLVVSVQGAPTIMTLEDRRLSSTPKWVNPCGLAAEDFDGDLDVVQLKDEVLLSQVVLQAKTALDHAQLFRDDYIKRTFNTDFADLHSTWKDNHYDWLPGPNEIPKQLGEHLAQEYLDKLEVRLLDTALLNAYEYMQRYAVGLEQIVWDQEDHNLQFRKQFKDTELQLRTVLCELQVALVERGVTPRPDVTRDVMSSEYRAMSASATYRNLRDWLIFRDYMNGLEYVVQVFEHLRRGLQS